ncbi:MAG: hypothetical protein CVT85_00635 [Alphaproteobacteria bacterium HGW-Alphaproteobacteria-7]|jgi:hypothetical protein|nr:MAG: hypothetical protein CVT85_00635 [Alphaproteobacteria bacterium HGW-Alphaproteobacteria-7]
MSKATPTYQQRLFSDEQLGLRSHDEIVRWVDQRTKFGIGTLLRALQVPHVEDEDGACRAWGSDYIDLDDFQYSDDRSACRMIRLLLRDTKPKYPRAPKVIVNPPKWELPVRGPRGGVIGFFDLAFSVKIFQPCLDIKTVNELPITKDSLTDRLDKLFGKYSSGIWADHRIAVEDYKEWSQCPYEISDLLAIIRHRYGTIGIKDFSWGQYDSLAETHDVYVEAKTEVRSAGELLRQMNLYRAHTPSRGNKFLVVAPRDKVPTELEEILNEQGIYFLAYQSN